MYVAITKSSKEGNMAMQKNHQNLELKNDPESFEADVLFQKIYNEWYAFSIVEDDCFVSKVPDKEIAQRVCRTQTRHDTKSYRKVSKDS